MKRLAFSWAGLYSFGTFGYVFSGLALSGIPGWSRLAFVFAIYLALLTIVDISVRKAALGKWLLLPLVFVVLAAIEGVIRYPASHDAMVRLAGTWGGGLLVGDAVRRGVPVCVAIHAMLFASLTNAGAALAGFDAYYTYTATVEQQTYASILDRRSGLVGNANLMAVQAVLPLFAVLIWGRNVSKILVLLGIACAIYALYSTGSRKSLVLFMFLLSAAWLRMPVAKRWVVMGISLYLSLAVALILIGSGLLGDLESSSRGILAVDRVYQALEGKDDSFIVRKLMIDVAQGLFVENPVFGRGLGSFAELGGFGAYAHNNFWELAVAGGLLLLAAYYGMHLAILLRTLKRAVQGHVGSGVACVLVAALLANDIGMVTYDEKIIALTLVLLLVWIFAPNGLGMCNSAPPIKGARFGKVR